MGVVRVGWDRRAAGAVLVVQPDGSREARLGVACGEFDSRLIWMVLFSCGLNVDDSGTLHPASAIATDATAVSAITRAQKDFRRPQCTEDISSKAHLDISVERVKTRHDSTAQRINQVIATSLSPRFLQLMCNTPTGRSFVIGDDKSVNLTK